MIATLRLGWYKVHKAVEYYAAYFTVRSENLDGAIAMQGHQAVRDKMNNIKQKQSVHEATAKDEAEFQTLQIVNEMMARKTKVTKAVIETLKDVGVLKDLPESSQMSLF